MEQHHCTRSDNTEREGGTLLKKDEFVKLGTKTLIVIGLFLISVTTAASAPAAPGPVNNIKAVIITVDDYEEAESNDISDSVQKDYTTVSQLFSILEKRKLFSVEKQVLKGRQPTKQNILKAVRQISPGSNEILFVYFSGHGGMLNGRSYVESREGEPVYRSELEKIIRGKNARLAILITDACNNETDDFAVTRSFRGRKKALEGSFDKIYRHLFGSYIGFLNISSSSKGEFAWADDKMGGYFTYMFINDGLIRGPEPNWERLFDSAGDKVFRMVQYINLSRGPAAGREGPGQTPVAYSFPKAAGAVAPDKTAIPQPVDASQAKIVLRNNTGRTLRLEIDSNVNRKGWSKSSIQQVSLAKGGSINLDKVCVVYYNDRAETVSWELETGFYTFEKEGWGIALYRENDASGHGRDERVDYGTLLAGQWELDYGNELSDIHFRPNSTYVETDDRDRILDRGEWAVIREEEDGEVYDVLVLTQKKGDEETRQYYDIYAEDDYSVELQLSGFLVNGEPLDEEDIAPEEDLLILYKPDQ